MPRLFLLLILLLASLSLHAQLVVYKLSFEVIGDSINYRSYQSGYYVAPIDGGPGSLILTLTTGGVKEYFTYQNFGEIFIALSGSKRKTVFTATAANTVSTTTFYAIGNAEKQMTLETRAGQLTVHIATKLSGYSVSADSERDLPFSSAGSTDVGVAGAAFLTLSYDEGIATEANREARSVEAQITQLQSFLEGNGFANGLPPQGGGNQGGGNQGGGIPINPLFPAGQ
jgi:hypothetical protein